MKDGGRITFFNLISSGLLSVVRSTQLTIRMISGQEATSLSDEIYKEIYLKYNI